VIYLVYFGRHAAVRVDGSQCHKFDTAFKVPASVSPSMARIARRSIQNVIGLLARKGQPARPYDALEQAPSRSS
jgi:hypothetical protein